MPARTLLVCVIALGMSAGSCGRNSVKQVPAAAPASFVPFQTCGETGTFRGRTIEVERTTRAFLLHVPPSFSCGVAMPLLVDFHGTTSLEFPEEDLLTEETIELANSRGFVLVRPRSLAGPVDGDELFQWDVNDGDLERNRRFVHDLVALVRSEYTVDPLRTYAFGFSNGTNMATLFLGDAASPFHGYAVVGGGAWAETHVLPRSATQPRLYATTGYRDYMYEWHTTLVEKWREAGHEAEALLVRPHHGGHEVYDWQVAEAWDWLDQGRRTDRGHLFPHWVMLPFDASEDLLAVTTGPTGLLVAGANGFLAREENGAWVYPIASDPATKPITDLCLRADGTGIAVGDNRYAYTRDGGRSWTIDATPHEPFGDYLGLSHLLGAACGRRLVAGGYWSGVVADEPYGPWEGAAMLDTDGVPEHVSDMLVADDGSLIVVGESWIGRSLDRDWREYSLVEETEGWMYGVARAGNGRFWVVGDRGQLRFSNDDGWHWETVRARGAGPDLFAVHFADERHGAAVGAHGTVLATHNGGRDWFELPTGLDHFLGGVVAYSDGSIVVAGEGGFLARWRPPVGPTR